MKRDLSKVRKKYQKDILRKDILDEDPFALFDKWMNDALNEHKFEANAMVLSTTNSSGQVSSRVVLLKEYDETGFIFYSNYKSRKASQIKNNRNVALNFHWNDLERQVRIEGIAEKIDDTKSDNYFSKRPRDAQIGAIISNQSKVLNSRRQLEKEFEEFRKANTDQELARPDYWGGYRVRPRYFEFWQGRANRLHDRFSYQLVNENNWIIKRLYP